MIKKIENLEKKEVIINLVGRIETQIKRKKRKYGTQNQAANIKLKISKNKKKNDKRKKKKEQ